MPGRPVGDHESREAQAARQGGQHPSRPAEIELKPAVKLLLRNLSARAWQAPIDISMLYERLDKTAERVRWEEQMESQTVLLALAVPMTVTYAIETGHSTGTCRHLVVRTPSAATQVSPVAVAMIADALDFQIRPPATRIWTDVAVGMSATHLLEPVELQAQVRSKAA